MFDGVTVSDKLRELLVNPESENTNLVFSPDQQRELLFHVFKALCVGGAICQPDERLEAYTQATKVLYKVKDYTSKQFQLRFASRSKENSSLFW